MDWKKEILDSKRGAFVTIENRTNLTFERTKVDELHGGFTLFPPEKFGPNESVSFGMASHGMFS